MGGFEFLLLTSRESRILLETFQQSFITALLVTVLIAVIGSYFVIVRNSSTRIFRVLLIVPLLIPPYFHALFWLHLLQLIAYSGGFGFIDLSIVQGFRSMGGLVLIHTISFLPIASVFMFATISKINHENIVAALLQAPLLKVLTRVIIPQLTGILVSVFGIVFTLSFISFDVPSLLEVPSYFTEIFSVVSNSYDLPKAMGMSVIPLGIALIGAYSIIKLLSKPSGTVDTTDRAFTLQVPRWFTILSYAIILGIVVVSLGIPFITILVGSSWDIQTFQAIVTDWLEPTRATLLFAVSGGVISVIVSFLLYPWWKKFYIVRVIGLSSLLLPPMAVGLGLIYILNTPVLSVFIDSKIVLLIGYVVRIVPITTEILFMLRQRISEEVIQSYKLNAPHSIVWRFVWWAGLLLPAVTMMFFVASWYISSEIPLTILLQPAGIQTVMVRIFILLHYGSLEYVNTMMFLTLGLLCIPLVLVTVYFRKRFQYG
ncbi:iron ABC transporter permease [bacterium]|uniref:ABC transmembrane type-1 domain-containing protein n=2 Tax=Katanobacteria TaxID=422282 RepID=A0A2H0BEJ1_UNCKA|nr:iron ABC transporter permease [bacterium]PIP56041.1 MAG: hypothetical protein COX05_05185 [candidate division WWE3 bacterium CG22_combo_CG10-13_8_21_14_all_39_12]